jgi:2-keto-4-pentenoate hydratase/2-oxohepta-3-ene-1,7-dioic acid hydratase in catechol pathway
VCKVLARRTTSCCLEGSVECDWEVELGVVIGTRASYVSPAQALNHVAGYCTASTMCPNASTNLSAARPGTRARGCDTFGPIGPWLVTRDEVPTTSERLSMRLDVNGVPHANRQHQNHGLQCGQTGGLASASS